MADIIKHGKTYKTIECKKCKAIVAYSQKDIHQLYHYDDFFGEMHDCKKELIYCPECNEPIYTLVVIDGEVQEGW